jgi:hypothetical protein
MPPGVEYRHIRCRRYGPSPDAFDNPAVADNNATFCPVGQNTKRILDPQGCHGGASITLT